MLNYAVKMEYLVRNPLSALGNFKAPDTIEKPADKLHYYTSEQFRVYSLKQRKTPGPLRTGRTTYSFVSRSTPGRARVR